mgnify:FL=1
MSQTQQGFTNTFILEANRLSSEEVKAGNLTQTALFTNKVNNGLKLNTGDVVSVHSAYISELGAEGSDIEIKGVNLDTLNASQILNYNVVSNGDSIEDVSLRRRNDLINGFPLSQRVDVASVINYRDDSISMVMNPYKNANGEFYIMLPYNYAQPSTSSVSAQIGEWSKSNAIDFIASNASQFGSVNNGNLTKKTPAYTYNLKDKKEYNPILTAGTKVNISNKHDNSRYSLYQLSECIHLTPLISSPPSASYTQLRDDSLTLIGLSNASYITGERPDGKSGNPYWNDIATFPYKRVLNRVNSSVSSGYNSNSDIASKITEDMLRTESIEIKDYLGDNLTTTAENQVNKTYNCATIGNYSYDNWKAFNMIGIPRPDNACAVTESSKYAYIEAHNTIGVKRPELYDLGRVLQDDSPQGYSLSKTFYNQLDSASNASGLLHTSIPWSKVKDLKNLVDAQHQYPELLDIDNLTALAKTEFHNLAFLEPNSSGSSFFLHINQNASHLYLGYDLNDNNSSYWGANNLNGTDPTYNVPQNDMMSVPIFFDINASTRDYPEGVQATGQDWENAVYGFAVKLKVGSDYFIGLRSSNQYEGLQVDGFGVSVYNSGTKIGWDRHFSAYGCPCLLLWNGFCGPQGIAYQGMGVSSFVNEDEGIPTVFNYYPELINRIYCGSPNTVMGFDSITDRFEFRNLHTAEKIGNLYNAGYNGDDKYTISSSSTGVVSFTNPDLGVPVNPQANTNVYKLNKQLLRTNWTPNMTPYDTDVNASFYTRFSPLPNASTTNGSFTARQTFEYFNNNFEKNAIYDSMCGNYIVEWGVNKKYWEQSLFGVMGFRYNQTVGSGNAQTRVINSVNWGDKIQGMSENTTNADVNNSDFDNLQRNMFNTPMFGLAPPVGSTPRFEVEKGNACHTYLPPVSITQDKGQPLRALEIPTRTLRPYYTVRSNIIPQARYFGSSDSSIPLPVVAVVEKVSQSGDFFNLSAGRLNFTITQPTMLTDITTSIHDPDGSYSNLSPNSAVLYQVERQVRADMNVVSTILGQGTKQQDKIFTESLNNPQPTSQDITNVVSQMRP